MFKITEKYFLPVFLIFAFGSCSPRINVYESLLEGVNAKPEILELHRDSVRFRIEGAIPLEFLKKDTRIVLYPEYSYGEGSLRFEEIVPFDAAYTQNLISARIDNSFVFPYLPGMERGDLVIKGLVEKKNTSYQSPPKTLAEGLETSPLLTRIGQVIPDQPIPDIGVYMEKEFSDQKSLDNREFTIPFSPGSSVRQAPVLPTSVKDFFVLGEKGKKISKVTITGLNSPSTQDNIKGLALKRAEFITDQLKESGLLKGAKVETDFRSDDWFDLRLLLSDYQGISPAQKEAVYNVLLNQRDFPSQFQELQRLDSYRNISRDLFPKLNAVKVSVLLEDTRFNNLEISASVFALLNNGEPLDGLTQDHLIFAGQTAKRLEEKEAIFLKLTELYPSELAFNNLGVVYLNKAQRELDVRERNVLISNSLNMFKQANRIKTTSVSLHNTGRAYILRGDYFDAYIAISEASALERDESDSFLSYNEGVRGALDIINGDYKLATIRLNRAKENEENLFNKGLAYFLAEDYRMALESFEECVQIDRSSGYGFYGLALVASLSGDKVGLIENLAKSIERSEYLKERALKDINFKTYFADNDFIEIFSLEKKLE